ncbi:uncharacterized protein FOMMEDRAFT_16143 [Fomitiporia mediterranea MF3/22]|uniref:uncharacterized protein n=1 Tax=Fomitiporia mediterranea (strain MF3/22) TaxID=694068 RepID=UPI0004409188|nr:uncharacterized protein FOMMEDRAFT_16143 [Fomitiporia mediterranea MF3/22]EJD07478.1 hypothetical protein FOMMEDRAFT_16143 [Fomitiporia mediterranea MF3/22]
MYQEEDIQVPLGLKKRTVSRIHQAAKAEDASGDTWDALDPLLQIGSMKIGDGRDGSYSSTHDLLGDGGILKRSPHHHDHDEHYDHDEIIVNGDNDKVHYHDRRAPHHHHDHHDHHDHEKTVVNGNNDDVHVHGRREPHRHHHYGHHDHEKTVVNGDNDDVHVHGRREPRRHHHHGHHDHEKTVVNGNNDDVHVHERREPHHPHHHHGHNDGPKAVINGNSDTVNVHVRDTNSASGVQSDSSGDGHHVNCPDNASASQWKRSDPISQTPGVPGTVDIMVVGGPVEKKLASLVLSSVPQNNTANNGTFGLNSTKEALTEDSPFVLDASNTTQTQFLLVSKEMPSASSLEALKAVALKSTDEDSKLADIKVTLQVPVFEPTKAAMSQYCATYDPNPPVPAPLTMEECGKETERRSQTFAYNPRSGTIRPMWFSDANPASANATQPIANSTSDSTVGVKQMNFKIPSSNKDVPVSPPVAAPLSPANITGAAPAVPVNASAASTSGVPSAQNVTLVFTPITPAIHVVNEASDAASFQPADGSGPASSITDNASSTSTSSASGTATSTDSSKTATATDGGAPDVSAVSAGKADARPTTTTSGGAPSNATDVMMSATSSGSGSASESTGITSSVSDSSAMPKSTSTVEQAAIERMYQQRPHMHVL